MSPRRQLRIVALGGGTGLSTLLRGLKLTGAQITAIVTLTDDGGSSGRLRRDLAMPPPGDIRNCLIALAEDESLMNRLFRHRFDRGELAGHAFGNIFLAALTEVVGSFDAAVAEVGRVLAVEGSVMPATTHPAALLAEMEDGRYVAGETAVARDRQNVQRLFLSPADAVANPQALAAVERADLIVLGPGLAVHVDAPAAARARARARRSQRARPAHLRVQPAAAAGGDDRLPRLRPRRAAAPARRRARRRQRDGAAARDRQREDPGRVRPRPPGRARRARRGCPDRRRRTASTTIPRRSHARSCVPPSAACATAVPFAEDVRAELAEVLPVQAHCRLAQLAGVVRHAGAFHLLAGGAVEVHIDLASSLAARRTVELLRSAAPPARSAPTASTASSARRAS